MRILLLLVAIFLLSNQLRSQQSTIDSLYDALPLSPDTVRYRAVNDLIKIARTTDNALARELLMELHELSDAINNDRYFAQTYNTHGIFHYYQTEVDSCVFYFEKSLEISRKNGNTKGEAFTLNNIAIIYDQFGRYKEAMEYYIQSITRLEELDNQKAIATAKQNIGRLWENLGDIKKEEQYFREALEIFQDLGDEKEVHDAMILLGANMTVQERFADALALNKKALKYYKDNNIPYEIMIAQHNVGVAYHDLNRYDSALYHLEITKSLVTSFEEPNILAATERELGRVYMNLGNAAKGVKLLENTVLYYQSKGMSDELLKSYKYLHEAQAEIGKYNQAYNSQRAYWSLEDSIASEKIKVDIQELETKYETEKKEAQIVLLNKEGELDDTRKNALWGGIGLLLLLAGGVIYGLVQRRKREQEVAQKEKEVEVHKRQVAEQELEFKKKELTAKALQLASKNEFLSTLEEEVAQLSSSVDASVTKTSARISRMIQIDGSDEDEWQQFSKEFSSVHQDFVDKLQYRYGNFTSGEMRLVSLLKMNLSSKEIANILRVSDEGIKKARYRLRKKMGLDSGQDLQGIIISI